MDWSTKEFEPNLLKNVITGKLANASFPSEPPRAGRKQLQSQIVFCHM